MIYSWTFISFYLSKMAFISSLPPLLNGKFSFESSQAAEKLHLHRSNRDWDDQRVTKKVVIRCLRSKLALPKNPAYIIAEQCDLFFDFFPYSKKKKYIDDIEKLRNLKWFLSDLFSSLTTFFEDTETNMNSASFQSVLMFTKYKIFPEFTFLECSRTFFPTITSTVTPPKPPPQ